MTETMILIALLSMAAGALLMELIHKIADLIRLNRALKEEEKEEDWERSMEDLERMLKALEGQMWSQMMEMPEKKKKKMEYLQRLIERIRSMISQMNALNYRIMFFMVNKMSELIQSIITSMAKMEGFV